jgi:two-component system chemotaxis sensor kinase CheA
MLEMFIFETSQLLEQLEQAVMSSEKSGRYSKPDINEIFRIMHTIKGSAAMMLVNEVASLAHSLEDVFFLLRESECLELDCSALSDLILEGIDFIKIEIEKMKEGRDADADASSLVAEIKRFLNRLKTKLPVEEERSGPVTPERQQYYIGASKSVPGLNSNSFHATIYFEDGCGMENIRAYTLVHTVKSFTEELHYLPGDIIENDDTVYQIRSEGLQMWFRTQRSYQEIYELLADTILLKEFSLTEIDGGVTLSEVACRKSIAADDQPAVPVCQTNAPEDKSEERDMHTPVHQSFISVSVAKLDQLMDLVGEIVIAEAMVTQNPDIKDLPLDNFQKAARQLQKITGELQDMVMAIRMVPLTTTFHKMHRVVRDMSKKLNKPVVLELSGEDTEVDKNVIEHISDPLMHLIRNAIDHGIEDGEERSAAGKPATGTITLEAKHAGSEVLITIKDDGRGINKERILQRARENNLIHKPETDLTDKEIYSLLFLPGFSTKEVVTEFSGRGVGMDVVMKNINTVGGSITVHSVPGEGTVITLKIPLTLAIIDGMTIGVGCARYTIPTVAIKQSFRPKERDMIRDPDGNEMIMVRGQCYPVIRLHALYGTKPEAEDITQGIIVMVETDQATTCLFADTLIGEQQVVVKPLPVYIKSIRSIGGIAGCTLLGDGSISLIIDTAGLVNHVS